MQKTSYSKDGDKDISLLLNSDAHKVANSIIAEGNYTKTAISKMRATSQIRIGTIENTN